MDRKDSLTNAKLRAFARKMLEEIPRVKMGALITELRIYRIHDNMMQEMLGLAEHFIVVREELARWWYSKKIYTVLDLLPLIVRGAGSYTMDMLLSVPSGAAGEPNGEALARYISRNFAQLCYRIYVGGTMANVVPDNEMVAYRFETHVVVVEQALKEYITREIVLYTIAGYM